MDQNSQWGMGGSASEWDISELHKGGVAFLRIGFPWFVLQPNSGSEPFAWLYFDRIVRWAADRGVWILAGLGGTPKWAVDANRMNNDGNRYRPDAYPAQNLALWEDYVRKVVTRYSARGVRYWGIWNEPDSFNEPANVCFWRGSQNEFLTGVFDLAMNVFRTMPTLRVCVPDLAKSSDPGPWLNPILARAGRNIFAVTAHVYRQSGYGKDVIDRADVTRRIVDSYNAANGTQIQLWVTETGWYRDSQHTDATISSKLQGLVSEVRAHTWVRKVFPYVWSDDQADAFTIKSWTRSFRVSWTGYKNAIALPQPAVAFERNALLVSHNVPAQLVRGQTYNIQMRFRNTGRWAWPKPGTFSLGFASMAVAPSQPYQITTDVYEGSLVLGVLQSGARSLTAPLRIPVPAAAAGVPTQGEITFSFPLTVPAQAAQGHQFAWAMVDERPPGPDTAPDSMWFGQGLMQRVIIL